MREDLDAGNGFITRVDEAAADREMVEDRLGTGREQVISQVNPCFPRHPQASPNHCEPE